MRVFHEALGAPVRNLVFLVALWTRYAFMLLQLLQTFKTKRVIARKNFWSLELFKTYCALRVVSHDDALCVVGPVQIKTTINKK